MDLRMHFLLNIFEFFIEIEYIFRKMTENLDFPEPNFVKGELQCTDKTNEERGKLILDHI